MIRWAIEARLDKNAEAYRQGYDNNHHLQDDIKRRAINDFQYVINNQALIKEVIDNFWDSENLEKYAKQLNQPTRYSKNQWANENTSILFGYR